MQEKKPYVLSIAGFDPSAGAGVLSDVKTLEHNDVYGFGVVSALTWQNDTEFDKVEWLDIHKITGQIDVLLRRFDSRHIKIGLVENMHVLKQLTRYLHKQIQDPVIIYDPILKASAGHVFHNTIREEFLDAIQGVYCITPNIPEANKIFGEDDLNGKLEQLSDTLNIYLKGGHSNESIVTDLLYVKDHTYAYSNDRIPKGEKHGSGCVLSAALTANLALGRELPVAAENANSYVHNFLASNESLLGYHKTTANEAHQ
jgi:hydroxymethylpyrimidine/phosphomethylpyrimidine kinase